MHASTVSLYSFTRGLHIVARRQRYPRLNQNPGNAVLSVMVLERALGTAFVRHHFQLSPLHLIKKRQHQQAFNAPINKSSGHHTSGVPLNTGGGPDFDVRVS